MANQGFEESESGPKIGVGIIAAVAAGLIGMMGWYLLIKTTGYEIGYAAWGVGVLIGIITLKAAGRPDVRLGVVAGAVALMAIVGGQCLAIRAIAIKEFRELANKGYDEQVRFARRVCAAETEEDIRRCMAEFKCEEDEKPDPSAVTQEDFKEFEEEVRPAYQDLLDGDPTREEYVDALVDEIMSAIPISLLLKESIGVWTALWLLLGVGSAFKIAAGLRSE